MRKKKRLKGLLIVIVIIAALIGVGALGNYLCNLSLRKYIRSFAPVTYREDRLVPSMEGEYVSLVSDRDIEVMHITDIHIGGGFWSYKNDKKTIYELITMLQNEVPDFVVLGGDNTYAVPGIGYNGGFTFNNKMPARTLLEVFEHEGVYMTTVFGNHDTEPFDCASRKELSQLYMDEKYKYCVYKSNFTDLDADTIPSESNQCIIVRNKDGKINHLLILIDTNSYVDDRFMSSVLWKYDVVHDAQVMWAKGVIEELSKSEGLPQGEYLKSIVIGHIPIGEYRTAHDELFDITKSEDGKIVSFTRKPDTDTTKLIQGEWGEAGICIGGYKSTEIAPDDKDRLFEVLHDEMGSMEMMLCGHDHMNTAVVEYKGAILAYGMSMDNEAYGTQIKRFGKQRGANILSFAKDGSFRLTQANAYTDLGVDPNKFVNVDLEGELYPNDARK